MSQIIAKHATVGANPRFGPGARIVGSEVRVGDDVEFGEGVTIACDRLVVESGVVIGAGTRIVGPEVRIGRNSIIGGAMTVAVNEYFEVGAVAQIGDRLRVSGQGIRAGSHLWITDDVVLGGGGSSGLRAFLRIGDRCALMDRCLVNLADRVEIGDDTALSNNVMVLTHTTWHPVLDGGTPLFGPVRIGSDTIAFVNAVIAPGVVIGSHATVGAGALVLADVPDGATAAGNPARVLKAGPSAGAAGLDQARRDGLLRSILADYMDSLAPKGVTVVERDDQRARFAIEWHGARLCIACIAPHGVDADAGEITLAYGPRPDLPAGVCHFDLRDRRMEGASTPIAEDLRDFLRRRTIRVFTDRPFRQLPLAAVARLASRLDAAR